MSLMRVVNDIEIEHVDFPQVYPQRVPKLMVVVFFMNEGDSDFFLFHWLPS